MKTANAIAGTVLVVAASNVAAGEEAQSLYDQARYRPLVSEQKAWAVGDVLTVVVQEVSSATAAADSRAQRQTGVSGSVGSNHTGIHRASANAATDNDGGGRTQRSGRLLATVTVRVTGQLPNGDLTIQGVQVLTLNGEKQSIGLSGVVRQRDIAADNSVPSSRIADARIEFDGEGFIADKSKPSWISRFLSAIGF